MKETKEEYRARLKKEIEGTAKVPGTTREVYEPTGHVLKEKELRLRQLELDAEMVRIELKLIDRGDEYWKDLLTEQIKVVAALLPYNWKRTHQVSVKHSAPGLTAEMQDLCKKIEPLVSREEFMSLWDRWTSYVHELASLR